MELPETVNTPNKSDHAKIQTGYKVRWIETAPTGSPEAKMNTFWIQCLCSSLGTPQPLSAGSGSNTRCKAGDKTSATASAVRGVYANTLTSPSSLQRQTQVWDLPFVSCWPTGIVQSRHMVRWTLLRKDYGLTLYDEGLVCEHTGGILKATYGARCDNWPITKSQEGRGSCKWPDTTGMTTTRKRLCGMMHLCIVFHGKHIRPLWIHTPDLVWIEQLLGIF